MPTKLAIETEEQRAARLTYLRAWRAANLEKHRAAARQRGKENPERKREANRRHEAKAEARAKKSENEKARYLATLEAQHARSKAYREANPEKIKAQGAAWVAANRGRANEKTGRRRASRVAATPKWLTIEQRAHMRRIYEIAAFLGNHVDHIVPLNGKNVCGLHVPCNLQILPPAVNLSKGRKHA